MEAPPKSNGPRDILPDDPGPDFRADYRNVVPVRAIIPATVSAMRPPNPTEARIPQFQSLAAGLR